LKIREVEKRLIGNKSGGLTSQKERSRESRCLLNFALRPKTQGDIANLGKVKLL
jgi:hypothetical protein